MPTTVRFGSCPVDPVKRPRRFDLHSALRTQIRLFGEGDCITEIGRLK
jgi:hypothetical protein